MRTLCLATLLALTPVLASAQPASEPPASDNGRYAMTPTADGFLRLDTRTGKVSLCVTKDAMAQCRAAADERAAYETEIADLRRQNEALRKGGAAPSLRLPSEEEMDKALGFMEKFIRRMNRAMRDEPAPGGQL
jgi:hypothetical protein